jgi:hypothetical protein
MAPKPSIPPAGVPSGNGKYIALAVVLLLLLGGVVFFAKSRKGGETVVQTFDAGPPPGPTSARNPDDDIPLPPPVEDAGPAEKPKVAATKFDNQCGAKTCSGAATSDLETALAFRAKQAHRCYDNALAADPTLRGKMSVTVRIGANGQVCSANVGQNDLPTITNCVLNSFRGQNMPAPRGGCADVAIPINFVPRGG